MIVVNRTSVVALVAILATLAAPCAAQQRRDDGYAFLAFLQSVASRRTARTCERGVPGYGRTFGDLYARWYEKHRARVERGEAVFKEALRETGDPYIDRAKVEQIEKALAELAQPPRETGPIALNEQAKAICDEILAELDAGLKP